MALRCPLGDCPRVRQRCARQADGGPWAPVTLQRSSHASTEKENAWPVGWAKSGLHQNRGSSKECVTERGLEGQSGSSQEYGSTADSHAESRGCGLLGVARLPPCAVLRGSVNSCVHASLWFLSPERAAVQCYLPGAVTVSHSGPSDQASCP